jgi:preprotein translocase subunit YajC
MIEREISSLIWQAGAQPGGLSFALFPLLLMIGILYFMWTGQKRRDKRWQEMVNNLKTGDKVQTGGGIRGTIIAIKDDAVHLRVPPDNLRLEVAKTSVTAVAREEEPAKK